jgi:Arc/MetJ-type ribon-helix-helix transcriptional regulator
MLHCAVVTQVLVMKRLSAVIPEPEYVRIQKLVRAGTAKSVAEFVRQAVRKHADELGSSRLVSFRDVSAAQAKREIIDYLKKHPGIVWPDEMAEDLGIDYLLVLQVVQQLTSEERVEVVEEKTQVITK